MPIVRLTNLTQTLKRYVPRAATCAVAFAAAIGLNSCSSDDSSSEGSSGDPIDVTASLSDWSAQNGGFKDFQFIVYDISTSQAYRSLVGEGGNIKVTKIPSGQSYVAFMLDNEFRFGWMMQFADPKTGKNYQYFKLVNGALGALFPEGKLMRISKPESLSALTDLKFRDSNSNGIPDGLEPVLPNNENASKGNTKGDLTGGGVKDDVNPDLDGDGVPNVLDSDIDNNGIEDLYDSDLNHDGVEDQQKPFISTTDFEIGNKTIFHEVITDSAGTTSKNLRFILEIPNLTPKSVKIVSGSFLTGSVYKGSTDAFDGNLYDDGTHGDGESGDKTWSATITLASDKSFENNQVVVFQVALTDGTTKEYLYKLSSKIAGTIEVTSCENTASGVNIAWTASDDLKSKTGVTLQAVVYDSNNKLVFSGSRLAITETAQIVPANVFTSGQSYSCSVRVLSPTLIPGYPGSSQQAKPKSYTAL